jgi:hypothetical protein
MKPILFILGMCLGGFIALVVVLAATNIGPLYTRGGVARLEQLRLKAVSGDISQAAMNLKDATEYWPPKVPHEGDLARVYELSRAGAVREIISRMRSLSGEDLGSDPQLWIDRYYPKDKTEPNPKGMTNHAEGQYSTNR